MYVCMYVCSVALELQWVVVTFGQSSRGAALCLGVDSEV